MSQKRNRSQNWDGEEKQLFCLLLKEYAQVIENKSLDTNTNKMKTKAWEEFHKKFNELNSRYRELSQMKIQWKKMKVNARKTYSTFKKETTKTGGGTRPTTPDATIIEIKDLLNPAELLRDHNIYDSDGIDSSVLNTDRTTDNIDLEYQQTVQPFADVSVPKEKILCNIYGDTIEDHAQVDFQELTSSVITQSNETVSTPMTRNMTTIPRKVINISKSTKRNVPAKGIKTSDYKTEMISHSKHLKEAEFKRRMEMAEEEHEIKMQIHKEKLKCMKIEREILEKKNKQLENIE